MSFLVSGFAVGAFYALMALAMQVIYASSRILNFAQGVFVLAGSFVMYELAGQAHLPVVLAFVMLIPLGAIAGGVFCVATILPLTRRADTSPLTATICTVAGAAAITGLFELLYGVTAHLVPSLTPSHQWHIGSVSITAVNVTVVAIALVAFGALFVFFSRTWVGRGMIAVAQNVEGAAAVGIQANRAMVSAFALSGAISFLAGALIGPLHGAQSQLGATYIVPAFTAVMLGGLSTPASAALGGLVLGIGLSFVDGYADASYESVWMLGILALVLAVRPHGAFSGKRVVQ